MHITTILGSARKKGNTATVLSCVEEELRSLGHDVEHIYLYNKLIRGCLGCDKCQEDQNKIACVQKDDAVNIMEKMISSEVVLFASPIYFWSFPSQVKALIDRGYSLVSNYQSPGHTSLLKGKRMGLLVTGEDAYEQNAEDMFKAFSRVVDYYIAKKFGELYVGGCSVPDALPGEFRNEALELARSLVR